MSNKTHSTQAIIVYGIPNCDSVKKARAWFTEHSMPYAFHDFKKQGLPPELLDHWIARVGWEKLLNRKGTTWRKLDPATQAGVHDAASARALMLSASSVVKRPVVQWGDGAKATVTVGFDAATWPPV
jgi:Spx/MgsR family transcriptional regulator